ncbi:hypothetical protein [Selenomonas sp. KH1T6]|uniref:hypothetical protein n=1 Tax=Selenomonas sp. KH1T6 TaxID=3158784 RepID=UPI0008A73183|nr:hypothetical protein SAMN05216583_12129 [Selenomonas ruminantium]
MNLKKIAASVLLSASLITFGGADVVLDAVPVVHAESSECTLGDMLGRIWDSYDDYNITSLEYGTVAYRDGFNAKPYVEKIMDGAYFEHAKPWETPEGQYVILEFPSDSIRYEFFMGGDGNYVRETAYGEQTVYHITGVSCQAWKVISDWGRTMSRKTSW